MGKSAPSKVNAVNARLRTILNAMEPEDRSKAEKWFDDLTASQAKAVMRALAG